jgi:hypothetical protein
MKLNVFIVSIFAPLTAVMVMAQNTAPSPDASAKPAKKSSAARTIVELNPPVTAAIIGANINLRGKASFAGEVLGHLQKGESVTVLEQITLKHPKKDEPAEWAKIVMPASNSVWVLGSLIDSESKTVKPRRINLRGGPGENYSVVGRLEKGASIKEVKSENGWVAIEALTNAFAYVAAGFLDMQEVAPAAATPPPAAPTPEPQVVNVNTPAPPVAAPTEPVAPAPAPQQSDTARELEALHRATGVEPAPAPSPVAAATPTPEPSAIPAATSTEPAPPRIVTREGFLRRSYNIQSPTIYELRDIQTGRLMDYLDSDRSLALKVFVGTRVSVKGPEGVNSRWPRTPILTVQSVDLMP